MSNVYTSQAREFHSRNFGGYPTFSGADIVCSITVPVLTNSTAVPLTNGASGAGLPIIRTTSTTTQLTPVTIGNLQTISISSHRDSMPVRAFKFVNPKGFTRGPRTIAGSMIFTMFDRESLGNVKDRLLTYYQQVHATYAATTGNSAFPSLVQALVVDEFPPFDVTITMVNEYGYSAIARIIGVQIVTNGQVIGIDDLFVEEQMSYIALDYIPVSPQGYNGITNPAAKMV